MALVARFAHSHSASQFLRHLPSHWNSDILPPHCGQTKLMIDEMTCPFDSPGCVSVVLIICSPISRHPKGHEGQPQTANDGNVPRGGLRAMACAPSWLAAESVSASSSGCLLAQHRECKFNANAESRINAENTPFPECGNIGCHNSCPALGMCPDVGELGLLSRNQSEAPAL